VRAAIDALPEADRLPVMLFYLAGYCAAGDRHDHGAAADDDQEAAVRRPPAPARS
jgi:hypothetical protein